MRDNNLVKGEKIVANEWTIARVKNSLPQESKEYHEAHFPENRRNIFYTRVAEIQNLIEAEGWRLKPPKLNKTVCSFLLMDRGVTRVRSVFGILLSPLLPHAKPIDRNGEEIRVSIRSNRLRIFASIKKEEARQLERQYGCKWGLESERRVYYDIRENMSMSEFLPVFEFAYNKHRGN